MTSQLSFLGRPARYVPITAQRWDWHWKVYVAAATPIIVAEFHGIFVNAKQRREVAAGTRAQVDYVHRTITECTTTLGAIHPDSVNAPYAKLRRLGLLTICVWEIVHFFTDGQAV